MSREVTHTHAQILTFRQVGGERRLCLLAVSHHLLGKEVYLCDLTGSQPLHPAPGYRRQHFPVTTATSRTDLDLCHVQLTFILRCKATNNMQPLSQPPQGRIIGVVYPLNGRSNVRFGYDVPCSAMQCQLRCTAVFIFVRQQTGREKEDVPELRISLQLQHRGVCVPLQRPDVTNRGSKRTCMFTNVITNTQTSAHRHTLPQVCRHTHLGNSLTWGFPSNFMQSWPS